MTLEELYQMQSELDDLIIKKRHPNTKRQDIKGLASDLLLAYQVEVSEFANATRAFKYWSNKGAEDREILLEEYVDSLHFFLSNGLQWGFTAKEVENAYRRKYEINIKRQAEGY